MSPRMWSCRSPLFWLFPALIAMGCTALPPVDTFEEEDIEGRVMREELTSNRARLQFPKVGVAIPVNSKLKPGIIVGLRGQIEAVQKGMWFGLEFDYAAIDSKDPVSRGTSQADLNAAETEQLFESHERYQLMFTWDYDIPLGEGPFIPIFYAGLGLGAVAINPDEAPGFTAADFDVAYVFVARPEIGLLFPFHENIGAFLELSGDYIPALQFTGDTRINGQAANVDIGDSVGFSTINVFIGLNFRW